ncbi:DNA-processing protein DprA [Leucobacter ruminantium]
MSGASMHVGADAEIRCRLDRLVREGPGFDAAAADAMLARIIWSRLVEPADAAAGELLAALGPGPALDLVVSGAGARRLCEAARRATGVELDARRIGAGIRRWAPRLDRSATLTDLDRGVANGMRIIAPGAEAWPTLLDDLGEHAPLLLWVLGEPEHLSAASLAVVGARACTGYGTHVTAELTDAASAAGATIVSGAAYGIDAVAHRTALAAQTPTVAVVAGGADRPYPAAHTQLLQRIAEAGAVCSEMVPGAAPTRWRFLMRNRIIAALSAATLVTEAGARSGSINTAGNAAELGRPLGAVPGPITSAASSGCHRLIREYGASLVTNGEEVRELLGIDDAGVAGEGAGGSTTGSNGTGSGETGRGEHGERQSPLHRRVIDALPLRGTRSTAEVTRQAGLAPEETAGALAELELLGFVARRETPGISETRWVLQRRE